MRRVLVIGDVFADVYRECSFKKMCPDAPEVRAIVEHSRDVRPGGAANVAVNLASLAPDVSIHLIGALDVELARMIKLISRSRVDCTYSVFNGPAMTKERIIDGGSFVLRVDNRPQVDSFIAEQVTISLRDYLANHNPDLVVISDYAGGTISNVTLDILLTMRERLVVDTKMIDLSPFGNDGRTLLIKLNRDEWSSVVARDHSPERHFRYFVKTKGSEGAELMLWDEHGRSSVTHTLSTDAVDVDAVVDVCGCGDTFLAGLVASMISGSEVFAALCFANAAASTVVRKRRTAVATLEDTLAVLKGEST